MNIELKPIAESKVRQLGGDVCGVLVRTEDSEVMAVSEHGRCTRLDAGVMGPVSNAPASDRDEFEEWFSDNHVRAGETVNLQMKAYMWVGFQAARAQGGQGAEVADLKEFWQKLEAFVDDYVSGYELRGEGDYTPNEKEQFLIEDCVAGLLHELSSEGYLNKPAQPQPAVPEGWKLVPVEATGDMEEAGCQGYMEADGNWHMHRSSMGFAYKAMLEAAPTPTTPQADGYWYCSACGMKRDPEGCNGQQDDECSYVFLPHKPAGQEGDGDE